MSHFIQKLKNVIAVSSSTPKKDEPFDLDASFCRGIDSVGDLFFNVREATRHGLPSPVSVIAYDVVQRLLAIGTITGTILVLGQSSVKMYLDRRISDQERERLASGTTKRQLRNRIKFLCFRQGDGLLLSIDSLNVLTGWNLVNGLADFSVLLPELATSLEVPVGTKWCFVGTSSGHVLIVNGERGSVSPVVVECTQPDPSPVEAISVHPHRLNRLLIGYGNGNIVLWDLKQRTIVRSFDCKLVSWIPFDVPDQTSLPKQVPLTCLSWQSDGIYFAAGYGNGQFAIWSGKSQDPPEYVRFACSDSLAPKIKPDQVTPIYQLFWCASVEVKDATWVIMSGGNLSQETAALNGLRIFEFANGNKDFKSCRSQMFIPTRQEDVDHFVVCPLASPWLNNSLDAGAVMMVTTDGKFHTIDLIKPGFVEYELPSTLKMVNLPKIRFISFCSQLPVEKWSAMMGLTIDEQLDTSNQLEMVCGGVRGARLRSMSISGPQDGQHFSDFVITAHIDRSIRFWDVSTSIDIRLVDALCFSTKAGSNFEDDVQVQFIQIFEESLHLFALMSDGSCQIYRFSTSPRSQLDMKQPVDTGLAIIHTEAPPSFQLIMVIAPLCAEGEPDSRLVAHLDFVPESQLVCASDHQGSIAIVDTHDGRFLHRERLSIGEQTTFVKFSSLPFSLLDKEHLAPVEYYSCLVVGTNGGNVIAFQLDRPASGELIVSRVVLHKGGALINDIYMLDLNGAELKWETPIERAVADMKKSTESLNSNKGGSKNKLNSSTKALAKKAVLVVSVFERAVKISRGFSIDSPASEFVLASQEAKIVKSRIVKFQDSLVLMLVGDDGAVFVLSLPHLKLLFSDKLIDKQLQADQVSITPDGRIHLWTSNREFRHFYVFTDENRHRVPASHGTPHDGSIQTPKRPSPTGNEAEKTQKWIGTISKVFGNAVWTSSEEWAAASKELDTIYLTRERTPPPVPEKEAPRRAPSGNEGATSATKESSNAFANAQNRLNERGEKLQNLESKFADLNSNSEDFLRNIREYNRRQEEKKWYDFF